MSREIDALIATEVMHEQVHETDCCNGEDNFWLDTSSERELPRYSTDIADAWTVVEKLGRVSGDGIGIKLGYFTENSPDGYMCTVVSTSTPPPCEEMQMLSEIEASTAPMAICLAALKALGVEVT